MSPEQVEKLLEYWRREAGSDWELMAILAEKGRCDYVLFFAHLAIEKLLKSLVVARTAHHAPPSHNLAKLADAANLQLDSEQLEFLRRMTEFNLECRYPSVLDDFRKRCTREFDQPMIDQATRFLEWQGLIRKS